MGEVLGALCIVLAVAAYAVRARALGHELRKLCERSQAERPADEQRDGREPEQIVRELRHRLLQPEDFDWIDLSGIEDFG